MAEFVSVGPDTVYLTNSLPPAGRVIYNNEARIPDTYLYDIRQMFVGSKSILEDPALNRVNDIYELLSALSGPQGSGLKILLFAAGVGIGLQGKGVFVGPFQDEWIAYFDAQIRDIDLILGSRPIDLRPFA